MQFKVPQFLEIEDKIFGPFTFRQFIYLAGGGGMCFVLFKLLGFWWSVIPILLFGGFSLALTFYRPNSKPFVEVLQAGFKYFFQDKLYVWKRRVNKTPVAPKKDTVGVSEKGTSQPGRKLDGSKLRDLAWSLDVLDLKKQ